jgi:hypothetical protein
MAGKERYIHTKQGKLPINLLAIVVGSSGLSHKTVILKRSKKLMERVTGLLNDDIARRYGADDYDDYREKEREWNFIRATKHAGRYSDKERALQEKIDSIKFNKVDLIAPDSFSTEGLIMHLSLQPQGIIFGDEFTSVFKDASEKTYLKSAMEFISRLFDCDLPKRVTTSRGLENPDESYVNFVSATTYYLLTLMNEAFFIQGTGNRVIWTLDDLALKEEIDLEDINAATGYFYGQEDEDKEEKEIVRLAGELLKIRELPEGIIIGNFDAGINLWRYAVEKKNEALRIAKKDILNKDSNLYARLGELAMRLTAIHCVGRYAKYPRDELPQILEFNEEDTNWAKAKMERHLNHYMKMLEIWARVKDTRTYSYKADQDRVLLIIQKFEKEDERLTVSKLAQQTGWLNADCLVLLDTMVANEVIEPQQYKAKNGRIVTYYKTK